jgi:hypothetical protein
MLAGLNASARSLAMAGLRQRFPHANEPALITARVTGVLEKLSVRYMIGGSLASTLHGMVRTTQDSDIVAEMRLEHVAGFVRELDNDFYIDAEMIAAAVAHQSSFNIIHRESFF